MMHKSIFSEISENLKNNKTFALVTVVKVQGSTPAKTGFRMVVYPDQSTSGTVGGGHLEEVSKSRALELMKLNKKSEVSSYKLDKDLKMACGGKISILVETFGKPVLHLMGAGHVAQAVAPLAASCNFAVNLYDDRTEYLENISIAPEIGKIGGNFEELIKKLTSTNRDYFIVLTYDHKLDRMATTAVMENCDFSYLGVIGSKNKAKKIKDFLRKKEIPEAKINKLRTPVGLPIGAQTPQEIAVSIVAELISHRAGKTSVAW